MVSQAEKAKRFRALHERPGAFVIPNPWDAGTARILTSFGFEALTTTSAGLAFALGRRDGAGIVTRDETLANARAIAQATDLPVAADLENGFGHAPEAAAETIRLAAEVAGVVGGSIEDSSGDPTRPIYDFQHAVERVAAAAAAARALPFPFVLVGRAENFLHGLADLDDTIRRLQAYAAAGADALYAPGLTRTEDLRAVCAAVSKPVNALMGSKGMAFTVAELAALGVRRISVGSALSRAALGGFIRAAREIRERGTFTFADEAVPFGEINDLMGRRVMESEPVFMLPPVSGFWRRNAALAIDGLLLTLIGQAVALPFLHYWYGIGPYGRLVGQPIALAYFGVMESRLGNGQTVGKRLMKIAVRNLGNRPIGVGRSLLRTLIWLLPATLNGWALPIFRAPLMEWGSGVIIYGVGGGIFLTMICFRWTQQGLHDMWTGACVVRADSESVDPFHVARRFRWMADGVVVAAAIVIAVGQLSLGSKPAMDKGPMARLQAALEQDSRFFSVATSGQATRMIAGNMNRPASRTLIVEAWVKGVPSPSERTKLINDLARAALDDVDGIEKYDMMRISVSTAYELGIAGGHDTFGDDQPIKTWRDRVAAAPTQGVPGAKTD